MEACLRNRRKVTFMNPAMTNSLCLKAAKTQEDIMKEVLKDQHQQHKGATGEGAQQEVEEMMEDGEEAAELQDEEEAAQLHDEGEEAAQLHDEGEEAAQLHEGEEVEMSRNYIFLFFVHFRFIH